MGSTPFHLEQSSSCQPVCPSSSAILSKPRNISPSTPSLRSSSTSSSSRTHWQLEIEAVPSRRSPNHQPALLASSASFSLGCFRKAARCSRQIQSVVLSVSRYISCSLMARSSASMAFWRSATWFALPSSAREIQAASACLQEQGG